MQMLNHQKVSKKSFRKSQLLIIGSFLIFLGIFVLSFNYLRAIKDSVFSDMQIAISDSIPDKTDETVEVEKDAEIIINDNTQNTQVQEQSQVINYSKYLGVLEIPRIGLKRGFYGTDSKYNDIQYNVTLVKGSTMPDVPNGNLILMAHSGDAYNSYFNYLYRLNIGNSAYVTYKGKKYQYKLVNVYTVPKVGSVTIVRNYDKTTLTLITCTNNDSTSQSVYILELV